VWRALWITALSELVGLLLYDLGQDATGHALQASLINALMLQVPLYLSALLAPAAAWALVRALVPPLRRAIDLVGVTGAAALVLLAHFDLGMQRFRGERASLNHLIAYASPEAMNSDWIRPVLEVPVALTVTILAVVFAVAWLGRAYAQARREVAPRARTALWYALAAVAVKAPTQFAYYHQRDMALAPQTVLFNAVLHPRRPWSPAQEREAREGARAALDVTGRGGWRADAFPLWRNAPVSPSPAFGAAASAPPDIFFFVVESLRGVDVGWGFGPPGRPSNTPHLDSLARAAVTFPHFIANGEPTPRGFIALQTGAWEHGQLFISANFPDLAIDAIPERLRSRGYHTLALWGGNPSFDNSLTWARRWFDDIIFDAPTNRLFYFSPLPDHEVMDRVIARVRAHDAMTPARPLFAYVASTGTHTPYTLEAGAAVPADVPPSSDRQRRYDLALRNVDAQIGRVIAELRRRPRWQNTVIIVVGDHADVTTEEADPALRGVPTDAHVATAALVFGPPALIGTPRVEPMVASQVDLLPTVLSWMGDTTPVTTFGRDLFDPTSPDRREAVSINSRGYRIDRGGFTLLVDADDPRRFRAWRSFTGERPAAIPLTETPFGVDGPARLVERIRYWSYLVEQNRVRPSR
jgi:arylsulfatase A-like enzyme